VQPFIGTVFDQLQVRHAVQVADCEVTHHALPVERERALRIHARGRRDRGAHAQVGTAVIVVELGKEDRLVAGAFLQRQFDADHVLFVHRRVVAGGLDVAADGFEVAHRKLLAMTAAGMHPAAE